MANSLSKFGSVTRRISCFIMARTRNVLETLVFVVNDNVVCKFVHPTASL